MDISPATLWAAFGLILLITEVFTLSFVVIFFGIGALVVAALKFSTGLSNLTVELLIFAVSGGACLFVFRNKLRRAFNKGSKVSGDATTIIKLSSAITPHQSGKIEYQGTIWDAYNDSEENMSVGQKVIVDRTEGIKLIVKPYYR